MRWILIVCFAWMLGGGLIAQEDTNAAILDSARQAYQEGHYADAIALYEQAVAFGYRHAEVYFNLGNAYYESNQLGKALVNYLRAQELDPRDEAIYRNIIRIRGQRADYEADEVYWVDWLSSSTVTLLTMDGLQAIAFWTWNGWFLFLATTFFFNRRRSLRWVVIATLPLLIVILALWGSRNYTTTSRPKAVITSLSADVYSGASDDYLRLYTLYSAAEIRILDVQGAWARFQLPDGRQGWVSRFDFDTVGN